MIRYEDGSTQLFDLKADPWTLWNLGAEHPAHHALLAELRDHSAACGLSLPADC